MYASWGGCALLSSKNLSYEQRRSGLMNKKRYEAPALKKVRLVVKNAVLGSCNSSPNLDPKDGVIACSVLLNCYTPPVS